MWPTESLAVPATFAVYGEVCGNGQDGEHVSCTCASCLPASTRVDYEMDRKSSLFHCFARKPMCTLLTGNALASGTPQLAVVPKQ